MKALITGKGGKAGSWAIRAVQLGEAIGAKVMADARDVAAFDVAIVVKRAPGDLVARIHKADVPLIYDVVDAWPQPHGNAWAEAECKFWLAVEIRRIRPAGIVAATRAMARDCEGFGVPVLALPHHCRPGQAMNPIRETVQTVAYEGAEHYLGRWRPLIEAECARRGWRFVVNPPALADADIVLALRDADGYAPRHWKSNVKAANAMGSGTPLIASRESGYLEQAVGNAIKWADTEAELIRAFDALTSRLERARAAGWMLAAAPKLESVAQTYRTWLEQFACTTAGRS